MVGAVVLFIYLLRPHQVRGTQPGCAFGPATGSHRPLAQAVTQWSYMLLKPDLAWHPRAVVCLKVPRPWASSEALAAGPGLGWL